MSVRFLVDDMELRISEELPESVDDYIDVTGSLPYSNGRKGLYSDGSQELSAEVEIDALKKTLLRKLED